MLVILAYFAERLKERLTAAGVAIALGGYFGWSAELIASAGLLIALVAGSVLILIPDDVLLKVKAKDAEHISERDV